VRDLGSRPTGIRLEPALTTVLAAGCQTLDPGQGQNQNLQKDSLFVSTLIPFCFFPIVEIFGLLSGLFLLREIPGEDYHSVSTRTWEGINKCGSVDGLMGTILVGHENRVLALFAPNGVENS
jgi:hypothetical protein